MKVYSFGDSWAAGAELKQGEITFGQIIADRLNVEHVNYGKNGSAMAVVFDTLLRKQQDINQDDIVFVIIPPDIRWYMPNRREGGWMTMTSDTDLWKKEMLNKGMEWFIQHHNMFMFLMQEILIRKECKFLFAHNYGELIILDEYKDLLNLTNFLNKTSLTELLEEKPFNNYNHDWIKWVSGLCKDGPQAEHFQGKYFKGNVNHPNQSGHHRIAELINEKMRLYG